MTHAANTSDIIVAIIAALATIAAAWVTAKASAIEKRLEQLEEQE